jgi:anti-sigma B factor antagonist
MITVSGSLGPWRVVSVSGDLDLATTPALRRLFADLVDSAHTHLLVDLSGTGFIDSSGLGVLIGAQCRVQGLGGELRVVASRPGVAALFRVTGLSAAIAVYQSMTDAELDLLENDSETAAR